MGIKEIKQNILDIEEDIKGWKEIRSNAVEEKRIIENFLSKLEEKQIKGLDTESLEDYVLNIEDKIIEAQNKINDLKSGDLKLYKQELKKIEKYTSKLEKYGIECVGAEGIEIEKTK